MLKDTLVSGYSDVRWKVVQFFLGLIPVPCEYLSLGCVSTTRWSNKQLRVRSFSSNRWKYMSAQLRFTLFLSDACRESEGPKLFPPTGHPIPPCLLNRTPRISLTMWTSSEWLSYCSKWQPLSLWPCELLRGGLTSVGPQCQPQENNDRTWRQT
ncbi:hypothetical protein BDZ97DRAFT_1446764 [Flammula alnicola]|nr:hypothetical protein BDZ97DRAFT_1446764 [Flammula alnicola]